MLRIKSESRYEIAGRGTVFSVRCPFSCPRDQVRSRIGERIEIDNRVYRVRGVEMHRPLFDMREGEFIGILVGELPSPFCGQCSLPGPTVWTANGWMHADCAQQQET